MMSMMVIQHNRQESNNDKETALVLMRPGRSFGRFAPKSCGRSGVGVEMPHLDGITEYY